VRIKATEKLADENLKQKVYANIVKSDKYYNDKKMKRLKK